MPLSDALWKGVRLEDGNIDATGLRVKGAAAALSLSNTDGVIDGAVIAGNETGISVAGLPSAAITNSTISGNDKALELTKTDARIKGNSIFQNKEGIVAKGFSGQIFANNVLDNEVNLASDDPLKIDANYLGSIHTEEMRVSNVSVTKTYDDRIPGGKIVDAESDPLSVMSLEDRRKRGTELAAEGLDYFRNRNYGKASVLLEAALRAEAAPERYHYLAIAYQEMGEDGPALTALREAHAKFPRDPDLLRALGMLLYEKGEEGEATKVFSEALRLNAGEGQVKFFLDRMNGGSGK
jgi:tetratricopeptide (TPR) repeat protein